MASSKPCGILFIAACCAYSYVLCGRSTSTGKLVQQLLLFFPNPKQFHDGTFVDFIGFLPSTIFRLGFV